METCDHFAKWTQLLQPSVMQKTLSLLSKKDLINFGLGGPAKEFFPNEDLIAIASSVLKNNDVLQYCPPLETLKEEIVSLMQMRGVKCKKEQIFLTSGAQQGIRLLSNLLLDHRGSLIADELTYPGFLQAISVHNPEIIAMPVDPKIGMDIDKLESLLNGGEKPAFIYTISTGHNPMSYSLDEAQAKRLVALARKFKVPILEDDPYGFLSYTSQQKHSLRKYDADWVYYIGSFSKILAPSLRVGWVVVPEVFIPKLSILKESIDINCTTLSQHVVDAYIKEDCLFSHLDLLCREYQKRRDTVLECITKYFPSDFVVHQPENGIFAWVNFPESVDSVKFAELALKNEGIVVFSKNAFLSKANLRTKINGIRLNFCINHCELIELGIKRLSNILQKDFS